MITHWTRIAFQQILGLTEQDLDMKLVYDVSHNIAKVERHSLNNETQHNLVVHRKGATRAYPEGMDEIPDKYRSIGQPVINPGINGDCKLDPLRQQEVSRIELWLYCTWRW